MAVLVAAAILLLLIAAAEAGVTALSRRRALVALAGSPGAVLAWYLRRRHQLLRTLSVATTTTTVVVVATLTVMLLHGRTVSLAGIAVVAIGAVLAVTLLRQTALTLALLSPERAGLRLARPIRLLELVFTPLTWLAEAPAVALLRALGVRSHPSEVDPVGELMAVLESTGVADLDSVLAEERRMMRGILDLSEQTVRELMSPRTDLAAVPASASIDDVLKVIAESGFTRIPLYEQSIDRVIGVIYAKDLLAYLHAGGLRPDLREIARPPYFVPETKRANDLLADMRRDQVHMAIAVDEYGGTAGVVTVEDLLEEIVGQISDEYDTDEVEVQALDADHAIVDARLPLDELNELFGTTIESEDFDSVGGLVLSLLGRLAQPGDEVESAPHGLRLRVLSVLGRRIKRVRVERFVRQPVEQSEAAAAP